MTVKKHTIALRLDKELHEQITLAAQGRYMSVSAWLVQAVLDTLPAPVVGKPTKQTAAERKVMARIMLRDSIRQAVRNSPHGLTADKIHAALGGDAVISLADLKNVADKLEGLTATYRRGGYYVYTVAGQTPAPERPVSNAEWDALPEAESDPEPDNGIV
ncbi:MAG: hypothetical protein NUW09_05450 [Deltaproteobacteria bacterium]|nr:hypothetical protein [Deltaproteobacteria bacterium]